MGRKKAQVNWKRVDQLAMAQCCGSEIANALGIHYNTLVSACKRDHKCDLSEYLASKKEHGKAFAKEKFFEKAWIKSDTTAQIFWTKQHLGWSDRQVTEHAGGLSINSKIEDVRFELPENATTQGSDSPLPPGWEAATSGG